MPVLSGLEVCECRARKFPWTYIVLSAHEDFTYVQKSIAARGTDYTEAQLEPEECGEVFLRGGA